MKPISARLADRILRNGHVAGFVITPKGNMTIHSLTESRGASTEFWILTPTTPAFAGA